MKLLRIIFISGVWLTAVAQANLLSEAKPQLWPQPQGGSLLLLPQQDKLVLMAPSAEDYVVSNSLDAQGLHAMAMANIGGRLVPVFVSERGVDWLQAAGSLQPEPLVNIAHLYQGLQRPAGFAAMQHIDFVFDLNHDGLSDLLLPDAAGIKLAIQQPDGSFTLQSLALPRHRGFTAVSFESPTVTLSLPHLFRQIDINGDGLAELLFAYADKVWALSATVTGANNQAGFVLSLLAELSDYVSGPENQTRLVDLMDVSGDGIPDLVLFQSKAGKDKGQRLRVYPGRQQAEGQLAFSRQASGTIEIKGELLDIGFTDFSGDGKADVYTLGTELGMGSLLSVMTGAGLTMQIHIYIQNEEGQFRHASQATQATEFALNMQGMQFGTWFMAASFIQASRQDLLYLADSQTLKFSAGHSRTGLAGKGKTLAKAGHGQPNWFVTLDTDNNGIWELFIKDFAKGQLVGLEPMQIKP
ncbi:hypothetical protein KJY73_02065 [Bowmanella sp. Y26]|uniref:FG-GAP repeat domain-containing protein n=1 Tax=Bowmanella yangjiangensis TaxID=2811230 RepID=UPI001BDD629F|nr:VCBS repeat-containing protein [Bowmanella yangjiangensis]MBT1062335.1 hypothetical protein [Bowmanella yangjiangensis]